MVLKKEFLGNVLKKVSRLDWKQTGFEARDSWPSRKECLRSGVRSAMRANSQLPGRGPTDVDNALHLHVNQKPYNNDMRRQPKHE